MNKMKPLRGEYLTQLFCLHNVMCEAHRSPRYNVTLLLVANMYLVAITFRSLLNGQPNFFEPVERPHFLFWSQ